MEEIAQQSLVKSNGFGGLEAEYQRLDVAINHFKQGVAVVDSVEGRRVPGELQ